MSAPFREIKVVPPAPAVLRLGDYAPQPEAEPEGERPSLTPTDSPKAEPSPTSSAPISRVSDARSKRG